MNPLFRKNLIYIQGLALILALFAFMPGAAAQPKTSAISIHQTQIDYDFLIKMEGSSLKGYVPLPESTQSGVTIGNGVDLGQMGFAEFDHLPLSAALKKKLRPYVGLKKFEAVNFLQKHPLTMTPEELKEINPINANKILVVLVKLYDEASEVPFLQLPSEAQTALFSFAYHYGPSFKKLSGRPQKLWTHYVRQEWDHVIKTLHSFDRYTYRRHQEAKLLVKL